MANETLELSEEGTSSTVTPDVGDINFCSMVGLVQSMRWWSLQVMSWRVDLRSVEGREAIRIGLSNVVTESAAMPLEQI